MKGLKVLDVTLRDGGCVNDFNFGDESIHKIIKAIEASNIDIIELGYVDGKKGSTTNRTQYINEKVIENYITTKKGNIEYVAMIDYGKYDIQSLEKRTDTGLDGIRLAFHKQELNDAVKVGKAILDRGYKLYFQPMITLRYSEKELDELLELVNEELQGISALYIVDSFGEMRMDDVTRMISIYDEKLNEHISIGFHSHNNIQMSYSNAISMMSFPTNRELLIDSSIMGMGKGAGNLNTELLVEHLNKFYGGEYNINPLLEVIDQVINPIRGEFYWGYSPEYYLSSINHCSPSYAKYYYSKQMLPIGEVSNLLSTIPDYKKISFDQEFAERHYIEYNSSKSVDDCMAIYSIKDYVIKRDEVLLIAPGRSIQIHHDKIEKYIRDKDVASITLNVLDTFKTDYIFTTRKEIFEAAKKEDITVIVPSNICNENSEDIKVIDYKKWVRTEKEARDSALDIILEILYFCGCRKISLAGFDGFSMDINENYANPLMRHQVTSKQVKQRNNYFSSLICEYEKKGIMFTFITPSRYEFSG